MGYSTCRNRHIIHIAVPTLLTIFSEQKRKAVGDSIHTLDPQPTRIVCPFLSQRSQSMLCMKCCLFKLHFLSIPGRLYHRTPCFSLAQLIHFERRMSDLQIPLVPHASSTFYQLVLVTFLQNSRLEGSWRWQMRESHHSVL